MDMLGRGHHSLRATLLSSLGAKVLTLPISLLAAFITIRAVVGTVGVDGYALYALVGSIPLMLPVADLGLGTAVTEVVARRDELGEGRVHDVISAARRRLWAIAGGLMTTAALLAWSGSWGPLLGRAGTDVELAGALAMAIFALSVPTSIGARVLLGGGRNDLQVLVLGLMSVYVLGFVSACAVAGAPVWLYPAAPSLALLTANVVCGLIAQRLALYPSTEEGGGSEPAPSLWRMGLPMLVVMTALPLTFHSARIVLSHLDGQRAVSEYTVAFQLYAPLFSIVTMTGQALWPHFAAAGRDHAARSGFLKVNALFVAAGLCAGIALTILGPSLARLASGGELVPGRPLFAVFGLLILAQAAQYPAGMFLMDEAGLRLQATCSSLMAGSTIVASILLTPVLGVTAPVLVSASFFAVLMIPPTVWSVLRRTRPVRA